MHSFLVDRQRFFNQQPCFKLVSALAFFAFIQPWSETAQAKASSPKPADINPQPRYSCVADFMHTPSRNGQFSPDGETLYLLTRLPASTAKSTKAQTRLGLYRLQIKPTGKQATAELLLALDQKGQAALSLDPVSLGAGANSAPQMMTAISFTQAESVCGSGPATLVSLSFVSKTEKPIQATGDYLLIDGPQGLQLADRKKARILLWDSVSLQNKFIRSFDPAERPVYFDQGTHRMVSWRSQGKQRGLIDYQTSTQKSGTKDGARHLRFAADEKLLQSGAGFAAVRLDSQANRLQIRELDNWTLVDKPETYEFNLPSAYQVASAALDVNFKHHRAIIYGSTSLVRQQWQSFFIADYASDDPAPRRVAYNPKQHMAFAAVDPTGSYAIVEWRKNATQETSGVDLYDFAKKQWRSIPLPAEK